MWSGEIQSILRSFSFFLDVKFCQNENNQNFKRGMFCWNIPIFLIKKSPNFRKKKFCDIWINVCVCVCVCVCVFFFWAKLCHLVTRKKKRVVVGFFWKNLHKFLRERFFFLFNQVPKGSYQVFNVFPKMFPIAPHFYLICFGQDWTFCVYEQ